MILTEGPLFAGMTTYVVPVLAILWGSLDHESISLQQMAAIAGVLAMVMLVQTGPRRKATAEEVTPAAGLASLPLPRVADRQLARPLAADGKRSEPRTQSLAS